MRTPHRALRNAARIVVAAMLALCIAPARAKALDSYPELSEAQAACICDANGNVLFERNATTTLPPASITKVMTAMVALDSGKSLDAPCTFVTSDLGWNSQSAGYQEGDTPTLRELLHAMLVYSGNDAALNVALAVSGSEQSFVYLMNQKAAEIGMTNTHFANPHGLEDEGHYSCAADLVLMGRYALENYPFIAEAVQREGVEVTAGGTTYWLESTDELMRSYDGLLGIKTGAVESGTAFLGASQRGFATLYTAVLGCETDEGRFDDTAALMDWAYDTYGLRGAAMQGWTVRMSPYALGFSRKCPVRVASANVFTSWPDEPLSYNANVADAHALVGEGEAVGTLWWRQSGRLAGAGSYVAGTPTSDAPAINVFAQPLF